MLSALSSQESAVYGAFLSSADLVVLGSQEKVNGFANSLSLKTLIDYDPEAAASAAAFSSKRVFTASPIYSETSPLVYAGKIAPSNAIVFIAESNQEIMDSIVLAYRVAEDPKVSAPAAVLYEYPGFIESVRLPNIAAVKNFLQKPKPGKPNIEAAIHVIEKTEDLWKKKFHRSFGLFECYKTEDAKEILVMSGFHFPTCKTAVDRLRVGGRKAGAVRVRTVNPFHSEGISKILSSAEKISVLDSATFGALLADKTPSVKSRFTYTKYLSVDDFINIFANIGKEGNFQIK
ncbi:MAG: hypothetical protein HY513_03975 [Candidatus Aenigmarchaeota archaeon]|nr:hypothetical protein [Candidatus Aenigmarchaeota archaeon]